MGMAGGGSEAFIGAVHRAAIAIDGRAELVCGAFSRTRQKSIDSGIELGVAPERAYGTYREMLRREAKLPEDERMEFLVIVTPNNMHYPIAMAALDAGFHVVTDKPMTVSMDEATNLARKISATKRLFCLTHNYTGYPMVKEARDLLSKGKLGDVRRVVAEYPQGWLSSRAETAGQKQAAWRTDPRRAGASCCMGDIGTHCANLIEYVLGEEIVEVCADLHTFVPGRPLDDDGSVLLRLSGGGRGVLWASQVALGEENGLRLRVYGSKGSIDWRQEEPNTLLVRWAEKPTEIRRTGGSYLSAAASGSTMLPAGHPEGFIEAFVSIYSNFLDALERLMDGKKVKDGQFDYPTVHDGIRTIAFVEAVVESAGSAEKWIALPD